MLAVLFVFWPPLVSWTVSLVFGLKSSSFGIERLTRFAISSLIFGLIASLLQNGVGAAFSTFDGGQPAFPLQDLQDYLIFALFISALNFPFMYFGVFLKYLFQVSKKK